MSILERLRSKAPGLAPASAAMAEWSGGAPESLVSVARSGGRPQVEPSDEFYRVLNLPRREVIDYGDKDAGRPPCNRAQAMVKLMTERLSRGPRACACRKELRLPTCITELLPVQAWALFEAPLVGGLLAPIGVGQGKTLLDILMAMVMLKPGEVAVLLVPPGLRQQLCEDYLALAEHWNVPSLVCDDRSWIRAGRPIVHVVPYSRLSRPESTDLLRRLAPKLIIADEAHKLRNPKTSTTDRFLRVFRDDEDVKLCCWSGTFTSKSIKDYAHLAALALREGSPLPLDAAVVEEWATAIDPSTWPSPPGVLRKLCAPEENLYQGYHRRLVQTRGVVATRAAPIDAELKLEERKPPAMPAKLAHIIDVVRETSTRPDGEEAREALEVNAWACQLACGFYYRWKYPHGEPPALIDAWFDARKHWHKELRSRLNDREEHMDSPLLCTRAAMRAAEGYEGPLPVWHAENWKRWVDIRDKVRPEPDVVWLDDYLAEDAAAWGRKSKGIIWYDYTAFARRVAELSGLPIHCGGDPKSLDALRAEKGKRSIIASIKSHGTGRNGLQYVFAEQLVANPPASADLWEQLLGRLHRIGFTGDEVMTYVYRHTIDMAESLDRALTQAKYIEGTMGTLQKLLLANASWTLKRKTLAA